MTDEKRCGEALQQLLAELPAIRSYYAGSLIKTVESDVNRLCAAIEQLVLQSAPAAPPPNARAAAEKCCVTGEPCSVEPCAKCPYHPIIEFHKWLDTYGTKLSYDRGDMAACWYAARRALAATLPDAPQPASAPQLEDANCLIEEAWIMLNAQVVLPEDYADWETRYSAFKDQRAKALLSEKPATQTSAQEVYDNWSAYLRPVDRGDFKAALIALAQPETPRKVYEPLTDSYIQTVPDRCDRIVWRNRYYHLPLSETAPGGTAKVPEGWKLVCEKCGTDSDGPCGWPSNCPTKRHTGNEEKGK